MRFIASGIFIVLGIVLGGLGILQKTVWAPSDTITATANVSADAEAVVIEPGMLNLYDAPATLTVQGDGPLSISQASKENVDAWLGKDAAVQRITGLNTQTELTAGNPDGSGKLPDPTGDDLFTSQTKADGTVTLNWDQDAGRTAFLVSGEGKAGTVKSVSISWPHHVETPLATALIVFGGIAILVGIVLALLALRRRRNEKLRRERRQERRRKLALTGAADSETDEIQAVGTVQSAHAVASEAAAATSVLSADAVRAGAGKGAGAGEDEHSNGGSGDTAKGADDAAKADDAAEGKDGADKDKDDDDNDRWAPPSPPTRGTVSTPPPKPSDGPGTGTTARTGRLRGMFRPLGALVLAPVLALTACGSNEELPKAQPAPAPSSAPAVVTDDQLANILDEIGGTLKSADGKLDAGRLAQRADGPALEQRKAAYKAKKKAKKYNLPPTVATGQVVRNVSSATDSWPRVTTVIAKEGDQTQALVLSQQSARSQYKLWSQTTLLGGAEIPEVNDSRQGSQLLDPGAGGYASTPKATLQDYARVLDGKGKKAKAAKAKFAGDAFAKQIADAQDKQRKALKSGNATISFDYTSGNALAAQATTSGALVVGTVTETTTIKPEEKDGEKGELSISKPQSDIVGEKSSSKSLEQEVTYNVVFNLPKSGKITLLGVTGVMTSVKLT